MTAEEFQAWVGRWSAQRTTLGRVREVASSFGWGYRRVRSWYYGERAVPDHIAAIIRPIRLTQKASTAYQKNAALLIVGAELDRLSDHVSAVERMCRDCEPAGECKTPDCPLRSVSPMPLARKRSGWGAA